MIRICIAQINPTVGDLENNFKKVSVFIKKAKSFLSDIVVFPELALTGYPPEDLLLNPEFMKACEKYLKKIFSLTDNILVLIGAPYKKNNYLYNGCFVIQNKKLLSVYKKIFLSEDTVFNEKRYFSPGSELIIFKNKKLNFSVTICEDIQIKTSPIFESFFYPKVDILFNISASPFFVKKIDLRKKLLSRISKQTQSFLVYCNLVGAQDELVFDGRSLVFSPQGELLFEAKSFEEDLLCFDLKIKKKFCNKKSELFVPSLNYIQTYPFLQKNKPKLPEYIPPKSMDKVEQIYKALVLGIRDYVRKNNFTKAIVGLSGGIDSSLTCVLAVDALGKENVIGVSMPSKYTSQASLQDAQILAKNLGIKFFVVPIHEIVEIYTKVFKKCFGKVKDITLQNIQARIRGNILMAFSNNFGWIVLTTGNKSELSVGYCTLYGDTAGGLCVLKDVPKTLVYKLSKYRNKIAKRFLIPKRVLTKPPTAELKPDQTDESEIGSYKVLDKIINLYVEKNKTLKEIVNKGFNEKMVKQIIYKIDRNEYKRRQLPPGIKITPRSFGKDRRMPITNKFII